MALTTCSSLTSSFLSPAGLEGDVAVREARRSWQHSTNRQMRRGSLQITPRCSIGITPGGQHEEQRSRVVARAIPVAVSAVVTLAAVGAAVVAIAKREKIPIFPETTKEECEDCKGSGLCPACNGEGFLLKNLSKEAAARARSGAKDAATRYTAGLAKKWSYCGTCSGGRGCPTCEGRGWLQTKL